MSHKDIIRGAPVNPDTEDTETENPDTEDTETENPDTEDTETEFREQVRDVLGLDPFTRDVALFAELRRLKALDTKAPS